MTGSTTPPYLCDQPEVIEVLTDASGEREVHSLTNLVEQRVPFSTQAYMLIYIRVEEEDSILREPTLECIPSRLQSLFQAENRLVREIFQDFEPLSDCKPVYLLTHEIRQYLQSQRIQI